MKAYFNNDSRKSGVYKIINIQNNRVYYGSCHRFKLRFSQHKKDLEKNKHGNSFLQADFNKCGTEAFEFHVLKSFEDSKDKKARLDEEQLWLNQYYDGGINCYNLRKEAVSSHGNKAKNPITVSIRSSANASAMWADPTKREEIVKAQKEACNTPEHKAQCSEVGLKAWENNTERKEALVERITERWSSMNTEQKKEEVGRSVNSDLSKAKRKATMRERLETDPAFKQLYVEKGLKSVALINAKVVYKTYPGVISPTGEIFESITNLNKFCKDHNLTKQPLMSMLKGIGLSHKGWKLYKPE